MSAQSDGPNSSNIDTIRQLLQKIEQAAVEDAEKHPDDVKTGRPPARTALASLNRGTAPLAVTPLTPQGHLQTRPPLNVPLDPSELDAPVKRRGGGLGVVMVGGVALVAVLGVVGVFHSEIRGAAEKSFPDLFPKSSVAANDNVPAKSAAPKATPPLVRSTEPLPKAGAQGGGVGPGTSIAAQAPTAQPVPVPDRAGGKAGPAVLPTVALIVDATITVQAGESLPFPVKLDPLPSEADALLLIIRGVPEEMAFSQGSAIGNEIWLLPAHRAQALELSSADNLDGSFPLVVDLVAVDGRMVAQGRTELTVKSSGGVSAPVRSTVDDEELKRLVARGDKLLDTGDIVAARAWYERAAEAGSPTGAFRLGETFDPLMLLSLGVRSLSTGDEPTARRWYERAASLGHQGATDRLKEMKR